MAAIDDIRSVFPALSRKVYGKNLVYFDNAATVQRPQPVIDCWNRMAVDSNANIHRAVHRLAEEATEAYESARDTVKNFINAASREEIVFTSGATASVNLVAFSFGEAFIGEGDEVIVTEAEHHSDIVPWQMLCLRKGAALKVLPVDDSGHLKVEELKSLISPRTKIMAVTHISNVLGLVNPVKEIVAECHARGVAVLVDGAQGIVHQNVDVQDMDCDFYVFSGHKMFAATGTGVLYGKKKWLDRMPPFMTGGEMVGTVKYTGTTFAPLPMKFEAGTQNFAGAATLTPAVQTAVSFRSQELMENEDAVKAYLLDKLLNDSRIHLYGVPSCLDEKIPLFSFSVTGAHHEDLALIMDKMGIALRSGQMCAEPLMDRFGVTGMLRASLVAYNTMEEAEYFIASLDKAIKMLI
ncbi:MAG: SufS family cysteine desulfurase [Bacteroidetes bacterium]|uniref:Cysteine desulfurase n=1 Tax=Candidatus Cryptobacteroides faecigallinarum TaxID=2840763 RepID=A0A9D9NI66_9BACT|nr:SufS family cysteine desulfurase [Candidatus Cryptobacteroides faecigallinarum]